MRRAPAGRPSIGRVPSPRRTPCSGPPTHRGARPGSEGSAQGVDEGPRSALGGIRLRRAAGPRLELQRCRVHAIAEAGWARPVVEQVAEVRAAVRALRLDPAHAEGPVLVRRDPVVIDHVVEARPARAGLELRTRVEQRRPAHDAPIDPVIVVVPELPGEGTLGLALLRDGVLEGAQAAQASLEVVGLHALILPERRVEGWRAGFGCAPMARQPAGGNSGGDSGVGSEGRSAGPRMSPARSATLMVSRRLEVPSFWLARCRCTRRVAAAMPIRLAASAVVPVARTASRATRSRGVSRSNAASRVAPPAGCAMRSRRMSGSRRTSP